MATVKLSESSKIVIDSFKTKDGAKFLNMRKFYKTKKSEDWLPTKQGMTIPEEFAKKLIKRLGLELDAIEENAVLLKERSSKKD